jgi:hypothetical protein
MVGRLFCLLFVVDRYYLLVISIDVALLLWHHFSCYDVL